MREGAYFDLLNVNADNVLARAKPTQGDLIRHNAIIERVQVELSVGGDHELVKPWQQAPTHSPPTATHTNNADKHNTTYIYIYT